MRAIRFRLWDKKHASFVNEPYHAISLLGTIQIEGHSTVEPNRYVIQQFTGLTDKNGKDIYEGDICFLESSYHKVYEVYWNDDRWGLRHGELNDYDNGDYYRGDDINNWHEWEVVGTVYEHPDLLK